MFRKVVVLYSAILTAAYPSYREEHCSHGDGRFDWYCVALATAGGHRMVKNSIADLRNRVQLQGGGDGFRRSNLDLPHMNYDHKKRSVWHRFVTNEDSKPLCPVMRGHFSRHVASARVLGYDYDHNSWQSLPKSFRVSSVRQRKWTSPTRITHDVFPRNALLVSSAFRKLGVVFKSIPVNPHGLAVPPKWLRIKWRVGVQSTVDNRKLPSHAERQHLSDSMDDHSRKQHLLETAMQCQHVSRCSNNLYVGVFLGICVCAGCLAMIMLLRRVVTLESSFRLLSECVAQSSCAQARTLHLNPKRAADDNAGSIGGHQHEYVDILHHAAGLFATLPQSSCTKPCEETSVMIARQHDTHCEFVMSQHQVVSDASVQTDGKYATVVLDGMQRSDRVPLLSHVGRLGSPQDNDIMNVCSLESHRKLLASEAATRCDQLVAHYSEFPTHQVTVPLTVPRQQHWKAPVDTQRSLFNSGISMTENPAQVACNVDQTVAILEVTAIAAPQCELLQDGEDDDDDDDDDYFDDADDDAEAGSMTSSSSWTLL